MSTQAKNYINPEQYLEIERKAEFKSEYHQGEMFAMAGVSWPHNLIVANAVSLLHQQLRTRNCSVAPSDVRIHVPETGLFTYPDAVVVCDKPQFLDELRSTLLNPKLIVEVLSPSTEAYDRGRKFEQYCSIPSFQQYLLVASDRVHVDWYTRQPHERWLRAWAGKPEETIVLESIGCQLTLSDLYEKVELA